MYAFYDYHCSNRHRVEVLICLLWQGCADLCLICLHQVQPKPQGRPVQCHGAQLGHDEASAGCQVQEVGGARRSEQKVCAGFPRTHPKISLRCSDALDHKRLAVGYDELTSLYDLLGQIYRYVKLCSSPILRSSCLYRTCMATKQLLASWPESYHFDNPSTACRIDTSISGWQ